MSKGTPPTWHEIVQAVDALAWEGTRFCAADAAALRKLTLGRVCELAHGARVREYNQLAVDVWKAQNPAPAPK